MDAHEIPLEDLRWLRALAERLTRDPHLADDAVQDTVVSALAHRPGAASSLRNWLGSILRNVVRQEWRRSERRGRAEARTAMPVAVPSAAELAEEVALHRRLLEHVHALDEPYHTVIVLRFLRECTPREIARDLGLTTKAVYSRIERGLAKLRERMAADRRSWVLFLGRWAPAPRASSLSMLRLAALAVVALLGVRAFERGAGGGSRSAAIGLAASSSEGRPTDGLRAAAWVPGRSPAAVELGSARTPGSDDSASGMALVPATGVVLRSDGSPVTGVEVRFEREREAPFGPVHRELAGDAFAARSDGEGRFALELPAIRGRLTVASDAWCALLRPYLDGRPAREPLLVVVGPRRAYAGFVRDEQGRGVADASVEVLWGDGYLPLFDVRCETVCLPMPLAECRTDAEGRFRLERVGQLAGAEVVVRHAGFEPGRFALPVESHDALALALRPAADECTLRGTVQLAWGAPAAGAEVSCGGATVVSDAEGRFALELEPGARGEVLRALHPGTMPAAEPLADLLARSGRSREVVLQLGTAPLALAGRVVDARGEPVASARVWTTELTLFGWRVQGAEDAWYLLQSTVEGFLRDPDRAHLAPPVSTDADGRFELGGLLDRPYTLLAMDPGTLACSAAVRLQAGARDVELHLVDGPRVMPSGRVLSLAGQPLAGVRVTPVLGLATHGEARDPDTSDVVRTHLPLEFAVTTDDEGWFRLPALPREVSLLLEGPELLQGDCIRPEGVLERLELHVPRRAGFRLSLHHPRRADGFQLEDEHGRPARMRVMALGHEIGVKRVALLDGRSAPVLTDEGEHVLVLLDGETVLRRQPVTLHAGETQELSL